MFKILKKKKKRKKERKRKKKKKKLLGSQKKNYVLTVNEPSVLALADFSLD